VPFLELVPCVRMLFGTNRNAIIEGQSGQHLTTYFRTGPSVKSRCTLSSFPCPGNMAKRAGQNFGIRYSEAFKMAVVRELEEQDLPCEHVRRKYGIKGSFTVQGWVGKYGNGSRGIRIRVEKPEENVLSVHPILEYHP
jgi:hypothetical protein